MDRVAGRAPAEGGRRRSLRRSRSDRRPGHRLGHRRRRGRARARPRRSGNHPPRRARRGRRRLGRGAGVSSSLLPGFSARLLSSRRRGRCRFRRPGRRAPERRRGPLPGAPRPNVGRRSAPAGLIRRCRPMTLRHLLFGRPLASHEQETETIGPLTGVAVLGLDALASVSYGPEAALTVLLPAGMAGVRAMLPIVAAVIVVLFFVFLSHRQTISAYPDGGGTYTACKENLGTTAALLGAGALALDYVLNVAVAIS